MIPFFIVLNTKPQEKDETKTVISSLSNEIPLSKQKSEIGLYVYKNKIYVAKIDNIKANL